MADEREDPWSYGVTAGEPEPPADDADEEGSEGYEIRHHTGRFTSPSLGAYDPASEHEAMVADAGADEYFRKFGYGDDFGDGRLGAGYDAADQAGQTRPPIERGRPDAAPERPSAPETGPTDWAAAERTDAAWGAPEAPGSAWGDNGTVPPPRSPGRVSDWIEQNADDEPPAHEATMELRSRVDRRPVDEPTTELRGRFGAAGADARPGFDGGIEGDADPTAGFATTGSFSRPGAGPANGQGPGGPDDDLHDLVDYEDLDDIDEAELADGAEARRNLIEWGVVLVGAVLLALILRALVLQAFWIPSPSMETTLLVRDRVLVNKLSYRVGDIDRGDVIVFRRTDAEIEANPELPRDVIKRVIALGGETIEIIDNEVFIDGLLLQEPYLDVGVTTSDFEAFTVPDGHVFVMGDNRELSLDSRFETGPIAEDRVVGRAFFLFWPLDRLGSL